MKTLQILPALEVGGVERGVVDLARAMKRKGQGMVVVSSGGKLVKELQKIGVAHYTLPVHRKSIRTLFLVSKLVQIIKKEDVTLVHARSRVPGWVAWLAARAAGVPFVTTCHGYYSHHLLSYVMGWGKLVIVISKVVGRHMIDDFGVPPDRIRLVHRGIDFEEFQAKNEAPVQRSDSKIRVINVGRLTPIKGHVQFLEAMHLLRRDFPQLEVLIVGSENKAKNKYTNLLKDKVRQLGMDSVVQFLGTRRDVPELIGSSDILVLSTLVPEAFGRVVVEAAAMGVPVVSTRVGGVLDIIDHEESGILVPPGDAEAMHLGVRDLLHDREKSKAFSERLKEKVLANFSLDQMVEKTHEVYKEAEEKKRILLFKIGAAGDVILITPSLRMLRKKFPKAFITVVTDQKWVPFLKQSPYLDEVLSVQRSKLSKIPYLIRLAKKLRKECYECSIDFQNSKWTHLLSFLAGIPQRYGFRRGLFGRLVNRYDQNYSVKESPVKNQFRLLSRLGITELEERPELTVSDRAAEKVQDWLDQYHLQSDEKKIGFVLGSSPRWESKRWPLENFQTLGKKLKEKYACKIILIGSPEEEEQAKQFMANVPFEPINLVGKSSLEEVVAIIDRLDILITGDTAPLHIASAVQTPFVSLFGPTDPERHAPPEGGMVLKGTLDLECQPCYKGDCAYQTKLACMKSIEVDQVLEAVENQLDYAYSHSY